MRRPLTGKANLLVQLEVEAEDGGGLAAQPTAQVNISIVAGTVSPPSFERVQYYFTVPEDTRPGSSVGSIHAYNAQGTTSTPCLVTLSSSFPEYGRGGGPLRNQEASTQFTKSLHSSAMDLEDRGSWLLLPSPTSNPMSDLWEAALSGRVLPGTGFQREVHLCCSLCLMYVLSAMSVQMWSRLAPKDAPKERKKHCEL